MQQTASFIIDALGEETLTRELGITERSLRHAKSAGQFSGLWFDEIEELCKQHGVFCSRSAFYWKRPDKNVGVMSEFQDAPARKADVKVNRAGAN